MWVRSVTAHAFGPLAGQTLELAEGLTVVHGPNESAKSSWHAAIYAALCGRRRRRGPPDAQEKEFRLRHRPWDGDAWLVSGRLVLDDGRRVELRQDLDGAVACDAVDLDLGRDCSAEIMNQETPDGARWLGLDRISFRATASIGQAQVLDVLTNAEGLQIHLQRAASTAAADQTAAAARRRIDGFRAEFIGTERAATRPLRRTMDAVDAARRAVDQARADHVEYERRLVDLQRLRTGADLAERAVRRRAARDLAVAADRLRRRAGEAEEVAARLPAHEPPAAPDPGLASLVAAALAECIPGPRTADGDEPDRAVAVPSVGPDGDQVAAEPTTIADDDELYALAQAMEQAPAVVDPALAGQVGSARADVARAARARSRRLGMALAAGVLMLTAVASLVAGQPVLGLAAAVAGVLTAAGAFGLSRSGLALAGARARLASAELRLATAEAASAAVRALVDRAVARAGAVGLPADATALREMAHRRSQGRAFHVRDAQWIEAGNRRLITAARAIGVAAVSPAEATAALTAWQREQAAAARSRAEYEVNSGRLAGLLRGDTVAGLRQRADALTGQADAAAAELDGDDRAEVERAVLDPDHGLSTSTVDVAGAARRAGEAVHGAEASLVEWLARVRPVGEAEEELSRAESELADLRDLGETLDLTTALLIRAEETAHRTIAPRLAGSVRQWLPVITGGRYTEVTVDPVDLSVHVRGPAGRWRDASRLSYGTAELVYLMLRIALAEQLAKPGVRCPLLLDDVTVHADSERTAQLLELLLRVAGDRQIIMFTQEDRVADWARSRLHPPRHGLVELAEVATV